MPAAGMLLRPGSREPVRCVVTTYSDLRDAIGGPVRAVRLAADVVAYCRMRQTGSGDVNVVATEFVERLDAESNLQPVYGPMVVFSCLNPDGEWDGAEYDCSEKLWSLASEIAGIWNEIDATLAQRIPHLDKESRHEFHPDRARHGVARS